MVSSGAATQNAAQNAVQNAAPNQLYSANPDPAAPHEGSDYCACVRTPADRLRKAAGHAGSTYRRPESQGGHVEPRSPAAPKPFYFRLTHRRRISRCAEDDDLYWSNKLRILLRSGDSTK
jgi:hypothetical protein